MGSEVEHNVNTLMFLGLFGIEGALKLVESRFNLLRSFLKLVVGLDVEALNIIVVI